MSAHRKIEWSLFLLGGAGLGVFSYASLVGIALAPSIGIFGSNVFAFLFLAVTVSAGAHVFHLVDGQKANNIVILASHLGVIISVLYSLKDMQNVLRNPYLMFAVSLCVLLVVLSLRLRRDFKRK